MEYGGIAPGFSSLYSYSKSFLMFHCIEKVESCLSSCRGGGEGGGFRSGAVSAKTSLSFFNHSTITFSPPPLMDQDEKATGPTGLHLRPFPKSLQHCFILQLMEVRMGPRHKIL
jgi:hypothetical protein